MATAKKQSAKKPAVKKSAAKKSAAKKPAAKKPAAKKPAAKKPAAKKPVAKARPSTRPSASLRATGAAKKPAAKKPVVRKPVVRKPAAAKARPALVLVDRDRTRFLRDGEHFGVATIAVHDIATLHVPTGMIVTCDPFLVEGPALARKVAPGAYRVSLAVATFTGDKSKGDQRIAAATVRFRDGLPARWEVAAFDSTPHKQGGEPGYPVDAVTGCFIDAGAQAAIKAGPSAWPTPTDKALEKQLLTDNYTHAWGWASYQPDPASPGNCVAFSSGYGDGIYSSYWGLDASGAAVCLTTDFDVFTDEDWTAS